MNELFEVAKEIIGLAESEAVSRIKECEGTYQVEERDGVLKPIMEGFTEDRVTMKIKNGLVIEAYIF